MATHDYVIDNSTGANVRADINNVLQAILTNNSNSSAPSTTAAYMWWADTTTGILKIRNAANNAWVELLQLDGTLTLEDGSASTPGLAFRDDLNTGIFSSAADTFNVATGGVERMELGATTIFNEDGADVDFRIEGDTEANLFYVDAGNDRIGIGTNSPGKLLHIQDAAISGYSAQSGTLLVAEDTGDTSIEIASGHNNTGSIFFGDTGASNKGQINYLHGTGGDAMSFHANGSERMRIDSSGNVGIGTTSPIGKLHISNGGIVLHDGWNTQWGANADRAYIQGTSGGSGHLQLGTNNTERMRIDSSGNVGIGTTSPGAPLVIDTGGTEDALRIGNSSGTDTAIRLGSTGTNVDTHAVIKYDKDDNWLSMVISGESHGGGGILIANGGNVGINTTSPVGKLTVDENNASEHFQLRNTTNTSNFTAFGVDTSFNLRLYVNGSNERMRTLSTGRFLFGRTSEFVMGSDAVDYQFEQLTSDAYTLGIHADNTNQRGIGIYYTTGKTADPFFLSRVGNSLKTIIRGDGDLENANNSYGSISDVSMKENIVDANPQWDDIKNIKVRNYNFKESTGQQTHTQIGVIAQELETVSPKLVRVSEDGIKTVSYSLLYMKAVKALQEAQTRIETLETKVAALEAA